MIEFLVANSVWVVTALFAVLWAIYFLRLSGKPHFKGRISFPCVLAVVMIVSFLYQEVGLWRAIALIIISPLCGAILYLLSFLAICWYAESKGEEPIV